MRVRTLLYRILYSADHYVTCIHVLCPCMPCYYLMYRIAPCTCTMYPVVSSSHVRWWTVGPHVIIKFWGPHENEDPRPIFKGKMGITSSEEDPTLVEYARVRPLCLLGSVIVSLDLLYTSVCLENKEIRFTIKIVLCGFA